MQRIEETHTKFHLASTKKDNISNMSSTSPLKVTGDSEKTNYMNLNLLGDLFNMLLEIYHSGGYPNGNSKDELEKLDRSYGLEHLCIMDLKSSLRRLCFRSLHALGLLPHLSLSSLPRTTSPE